MALFDTGLTESITKAIDKLGKSSADATAKAIIEGFERAAVIVAASLKEDCDCKK